MARRWFVGLLTLGLGCGDGGHATIASASASTAAAESAQATALVSATAQPSASAPAPPGPLAGSAVLRDIQWLAAPEQRGRGSGTQDEVAAREWIVRSLEAAGLKPTVMPFQFSRGRKSANVLVTIEPTTPDKREAVFLGAHYDHVGFRHGKIYPGADDNASGTAVLLAIARQLASRREELHRPVIVAFFGAEETGLHGSTALVAKWSFKERPVSTMVNIDMIGRPLLDQPEVWLAAKLAGLLPGIEQDRGLGLVLPDKPGELGALAKAACAEEGVQVVTIDDLPSRMRKQVDAMSRGRSDHAPFQDRGIPFLFFSSAESTDYHAPGDTADKIDPLIMERRARAIYRTVMKLAQ